MLWLCRVRNRLFCFSSNNFFFLDLLLLLFSLFLIDLCYTSLWFLVLWIRALFTWRLLFTFLFELHDSMDWQLAFVKVRYDSLINYASKWLSHNFVRQFTLIKGINFVFSCRLMLSNFSSFWFWLLVSLLCGFWFLLVISLHLRGLLWLLLLVTLNFNFLFLFNKRNIFASFSWYWHLRSHLALWFYIFLNLFDYLWFNWHW